MATYIATPLRELTCHMGSHSVTYHPVEMTFPPLPLQNSCVMDVSGHVGLWGRAWRAW